MNNCCKLQTIKKETFLLPCEKKTWTAKINSIKAISTKVYDTSEYLLQMAVFIIDFKPYGVLNVIVDIEKLFL